MADTTRQPTTAAEHATSGPTRSWLAYLGPGLVLAAASVGAGDMVTSINGAVQFGMGLLWVVVLGVVVKYVLTEAVGRHYLATRTPIIADLGQRARPLALLLFAAFVIIGLLYGGGLSSIAALALSTLFPALPVIPVAIAAAVLAAAIVLYGRYSAFESIMKFFIAAKFGLMVLLAGLALTRVDDWGAFLGTLRPTLPAGSLLDVAALIGGVGGTAGVVAYGYWVRERGWESPSWLQVMRVDVITSYVVIFLFVVATTVVGTILIYGTGQSVKGTGGLAVLADPIAADLGAFARVVFLLTFALVAFSALVGGFNGLSHQLVDSLRAFRKDAADPHGGSVERSPLFRGFVLALLACAIVVVFIGRPVSLLLTYAAAGSMVLPILATALLLRLNHADVDSRLRNGITSNVIMALAVLMFATLAGFQIMGFFT